MIDVLLRLAVFTLTVVAWLSAGVLIRAGIRAHIGALTERAVAAVVIASFGTIYSLVLANSGFLFVPHDVVTAAVRVGVLGLLLVPVYWAALYLTGRLGDNGDGGP